MERDFERLHPEIDVRWLDLGSQEVLDRLRLERVNPQADVWFGGPTTLFQRGVAESLLAPYRPTWAGAVDSGGIGAGDMYYPVYRTPAIIAYNNAAVPDRPRRAIGRMCSPRVGTRRCSFGIRSRAAPCARSGA